MQSKRPSFHADILQLYLNKVLVQMFSCEFYKIVKNTIFI